MCWVRVRRLNGKELQIQRMHGRRRMTSHFHHWSRTPVMKKNQTAGHATGGNLFFFFFATAT
jgi:hypothetical protein